MIDYYEAGWLFEFVAGIVSILRIILKTILQAEKKNRKIEIGR